MSRLRVLAVVDRRDVDGLHQFRRLVRRQVHILRVPEDICRIHYEPGRTIVRDGNPLTALYTVERCYRCRATQ